MAEVLLDLISLQRIGVKLVVAYSGVAQEDLLDWAAELEFKLSVATVETASAVLARGQAALVSRHGAIDEQLVSLALEVQANKVLYLGGGDDYPAEWSGALSLDDARDLLTDSHEKAYWAVQAVERGINRVHLLDGKMLGCLSKELFSNEGVGVMIYADSYQEIRALSQEDIPELLAIIGRSVRAQHLVPRGYEEVEQQLGDYFVMTIDGNVVGSVALHSYGDSICELACLFVKESHKGLGYGNELVSFAEGEARERGFSQIFALSTDAGGFFERQLHYEPVALDRIPSQRYEKLIESGRQSVALIKNLQGG